MTVRAGGYTLRGQETGPNLFAAIDAVTDVMDRQIQKFKGRVYRTATARKSARAGRTRPAGMMAETESGPTEVADEPEFGRIVRTKRFPVKPMTVEDAVLEMEFLGHSFFLFNNLDSGEYNVVYRRHDGDYGVIEPELG